VTTEPTDWLRGALYKLPSRCIATHAVRSDGGSGAWERTHSVETVGELDESGLAAAEVLKVATGRMAWHDGSARAAVMMVSAAPSAPDAPFLSPSAVRGVLPTEAAAALPEAWVEVRPLHCIPARLLSKGA
jgi:hypothetical protein